MPARERWRVARVERLEPLLPAAPRGDQTIEPGWLVNGGRLPAAIVPNVLTMPNDGAGRNRLAHRLHEHVVRAARRARFERHDPQSRLAGLRSRALGQPHHVLAPIHLVRSDATHWFADLGGGFTDRRAPIRRGRASSTPYLGPRRRAIRAPRLTPLNLKTFSDGASGCDDRVGGNRAFAVTRVLADGSSPDSTRQGRARDGEPAQLLRQPRRDLSRRR